VFCSFLPLLLKAELERRMKFADLQCEWSGGRRIRGLEALQQVEATFQDKCFLLRSQLTGEASAAFAGYRSRRATHVAHIILDDEVWPRLTLMSPASGIGNCLIRRSLTWIGGHLTEP
jgi:hypothetical protein